MLNGLTGEDLKILTRSPIFHGISEMELTRALEGVLYTVRTYQKGEVIFSEDDTPGEVMILLSGSLTLASDTVSGKRIMLSVVNMPGELFGEIYAFIGLPRYDIYGIADTSSRVFFISYEIVSEQERSRLHEKIRDNLLRIFATKAYSMNRRLRILGGSTIREKIVRYLFENHLKGDYIVTPTREVLADYLNVTRPSLSRELSHMVGEGLIRIQGRKIFIVDQEALESYL